jgi:hypothetical protein
MVSLGWKGLRNAAGGESYELAITIAGIPEMIRNKN